LAPTWNALRLFLKVTAAGGGDASRRTASPTCPGRRAPKASTAIGRRRLCRRCLGGVIYFMRSNATFAVLLQLWHYVHALDQHLDFSALTHQLVDGFHRNDPSGHRLPLEAVIDRCPPPVFRSRFREVSRVHPTGLSYGAGPALTTTPGNSIGPWQ
jgi:hypothetical protein